MLKKLLKYELKSSFKFLIIFYLLAFFFAFLTRIFFSIENSIIVYIIAQICTGATIAIICNILVNNVIRNWVTFRNNVYGDESYLTHTLPVSKKNIYTSKFLSSLITLFTSFIAIVITLFIAYYSKENMELLKDFVGPLANIFNSSDVVLILALIFMVFIEILNLLQTGYTGIILGHRKNYKKNSFSLIYGFGVYMLTQIAVLIGLFIIALFNSDLMNMFFTNDQINFDMFKLLYLLCTAIYFITIIILYFVNIKLLNKGVNVD